MRVLVLCLIAVQFSLAAVMAPPASVAPVRLPAYTFSGGTLYEHSQVRKALAVSAFNWNVLPQTVIVHISRGLSSSWASPGNVYLDSDLLDAGTFSWGVVQHEFAHQVDFLVLDGGDRQQLQAALGASVWCNPPGLTHDAYGCERFASTLAWAYWPSADNCMQPTGGNDLESGSIPPAAFRALLAQILAAHGFHDRQHALIRA